jgi:hypothetical protein
VLVHTWLVSVHAVPLFSCIPLIRARLSPSASVMHDPLDRDAYFDGINGRPAYTSPCSLATCFRSRALFPIEYGICDESKRQTVSCPTSILVFFILFSLSLSLSFSLSYLRFRMVCTVLLLLRSIDFTVIIY